MEKEKAGRCDLLNTSPSSKGDLNQIFICSEEGCDSRFSKRAYLEQHMCIHTTERPFVCPTEGCNRSYKRKDHLNRHTKLCPSSQLPELTQFPCTVEGCEQNFSKMDDVRKHIRVSHSTKKKTFPCLYEGCSQIFKKHKELRAHKFEHTQKNPFECIHPGCEMSFRWMNRLKKHMKVHEGYNCPVCGEKFEKWTLLLKHKTSEHRTQQTCSLCQKTFSHRHRLKLHMKIHSEEREVYECPRDGCGRYYSEKRNLDAHIRSYHDGRRFPCTHESCDRTFAFKHKMQEHLKTHSMTGKFKSKLPKKGHRKRKVASLLTGINSEDGDEESLDSDDLLPLSSNQTESSMLPSFDWGGSNEIWDVDNCSRLEETNSSAPKTTEDSNSLSGFNQLAEAPVQATIDDTEHSKDRWLPSINLIEDLDHMQKSGSGEPIAKSSTIHALDTANPSDSYSLTNTETSSESDTTESTQINKNHSTSPNSSDTQGNKNPQLLRTENDNSGNGDQPVTTDNLFRCVFCSLSFKCESLLKEHQKQHITEPQSFSCPRRKCQSVYTTQRKLDLHLQCDHDGLGFQCMYVNCGMVFESQRSLEKHFSIHNVKMRQKKKKKLAKFILENFANCYSIILKNEQAHEDSIWSCAWGRNENDGIENIVTGSVDDVVKIWKWDGKDNSLKIRHILEGHQLGIVSIDINSTGSLAATSSLGSQIRVWDLQTGKLAKGIDANPADAWTIAFSPDSRYLATGSHTGKINLFGVDSGQKESSMDTRGKFVLSLAYSPDGKYIACGAIDGIVNIFDTTTGRLLHTLEGHAMPIRSLCFSPDSQLLVTGSDDSHIKIYDVLHANLVGTLSGHGSWVLTVDFNPDNTHFVSGSSDRKVKIWDAGTRQCVHTFGEHADQVWCAKYNPDGSKVVSVSDDKSVYVYDCPL